MELAARRGTRADFEAAGAAIMAGLRRSPIFHASRAHIGACLGVSADVMEALDALMARLADGPQDNDWVAMLVMGAHAAIVLGAKPQATRLFERLLPYRDHWAVIGNATVSRGPVTGVLAGLARVIGDADAASALEAEAHAAIQRAGAPGARFWLTGGPHWSPAQPAPANLAGLTSREQEVLALVAAGCSNQEIADRLVLSIRTVQRHVENIYAKTGAHGRAAASVFAATHGLVATDSSEHA
jgi:DNA-binding CsgD family transcriptional regulator